MKTQSGNNTRYVLDSTAFFTMFEDEEGADTVQDLLERATRGEIFIFVSFVTFAEVFYVTIRRKGEEEGLMRMALMEALAVTRIESSKELSLIAGRLKALYIMSFADAWVAATAMFYDAILVHKDPEFEQLEDKVKVLNSPISLKETRISDSEPLELPNRSRFPLYNAR